MVDAYAGAVRCNGRIAGKDAVSAYHEDDEVDEGAPRAALNDAIRTILSALAKAEGDSKRLEFLEERAAPDAHISFETVATTEIDINGFSVEDDLFRLFFEPPREADNVPNYWGRSLREAIDLAMTKERE
jgi:hypothetical protein